MLYSTVELCQPDGELTFSLLQYDRVNSLSASTNFLFRNCMFSFLFFHSIPSQNPGFSSKYPLSHKCFKCFRSNSNLMCFCYIANYLAKGGNLPLFFFLLPDSFCMQKRMFSLKFCICMRNCITHISFTPRDLCSAVDTRVRRHHLWYMKEVDTWFLL